MTRKNHRIALILILFATISSAVFFYLRAELKYSPAGKMNYPPPHERTDIDIKGFRFSGYQEGRQTLTIKAAKFRVRKKKISIFSFSPVREAEFRDAEIDLFINDAQTAADPLDQNYSTLKGLFEQETLLVSSLKGAKSIVFKPVKINFRFENAPATKIRATKATIDNRRQRIVLKGEIHAQTESKQLLTERLVIYPQKGTLEVTDNFVLKSPGAQTKGHKLITDFFLNKKS